MTIDASELQLVSPTKELKNWIRGEIHRLQAGYRKDEPTAVAILAQLRRSGRTGEVRPEVWEFLQKLPKSCVGREDDPSSQERAAATVIGLYSIHQQGKRTLPMHVNDVPLGRAMRRLSSGDDLDQALARRFKVLLSADGYDEVVHHLRGLIQRLRSDDIGLDYGLLAVDLSNVQHPARRDDVRRRWARDFYVRARSASSENQPDQPEHETGADQ